MSKFTKTAPTEKGFLNVVFPSVDGHTFRVTIQSSSKGLVIWTEDKRSKAQWQQTVEDLAACGQNGVSGVPQQTLLMFLSVS